MKERPTGLNKFLNKILNHPSFPSLLVRINCPKKFIIINGCLPKLNLEFYRDKYITAALFQYDPELFTTMPMTGRMRRKIMFK